MANEIVNRGINIFIQSGDAEKAYDSLIAKQKKLNDELTAVGTHPKRIAVLKDELKKLEEPISRAGKKMRNELLPTINDLQRSTKKWLDEFKRTGDSAALANFQKFNEQLKLAKNVINGLQVAQNGLDKKGVFSAAFWASLAANGILIAANAVRNFFRGSIDEALQADEATKRLNSTLSNLGRNDSFDRIIRKSKDLAKQFRFLDNDDIVAVFNKLIDYGKLTEKEMNELLPVIINFAAKSKISIAESSDIIVKALEGNSRALKQYGINVKEGGDETERLNIIMTTLKDKVEGSAEAFQNSFAGSIATSKQELKDLQEEIGNQLIPMLVKLERFALKAISNIKSFFNAIGAELSGKNGFIQIAIDQVNSDPLLQQSSRDQAEQLVNTFTSAQKNIEAQLKRPLDLKNKTDAKILQDNQVKIIEGFKNSLGADIKRLEEIKKSTGREGQLEARDLSESIVAAQLALDQIELLFKKEPGTLGIRQPDAPKKDKPTDPIKTFRKLILGDNPADELDRDPELKKKIEDAAAKVSEAFQKGLADRANRVNPIISFFEDRISRDRLAANELNVLRSRGKKKLEAELFLLDEQEKQELASKKHTASEVAKIEEQFRQARQKAEDDYFLNLIDNIKNFAEQALGVFDAFNNARATKENAELDRDRRLNDAKIKNLDNRLKKGLITQAQYDREVNKLKSIQEKKEREVQLQQFKRGQKIAIASALINAAAGIAATFAARPGLADIFTLGVARAIQIGIIAATTAAQIAQISAQKPQFARGGKLGGAYHSEGGNPIIDGKTGRKIAEIEKDEGIINKFSMRDKRVFTVTGTPSQISSRMNSLYGHGWEPGARLVPKWSTRMPVPINMPVIKKYYATGGRFSSTNDNNKVVDDKTSNAINNLNDTVAGLSAVVNNLQRDGIVAYTLLSQNEKQQLRKNAILADATLR